MSYLLTNSSALTALQNLTLTQQSLTQTQSQLSTGLAVANASDNSSYWSIAQTMSSDNGALSSVASSLKVSAQMLNTFTSAINQSISVVNNIKNDLVEAQSSGANLTQIGADITNQQNLLVNIGNSATFNGQNWLNGNSQNGADVNSVSIATSYTNSGGVSAQTETLSSTNIQLFDTSGGTNTTASTVSGGVLATAGTNGYSVLGSAGVSVTSTTTQADLNKMLSDVNNIISNMETSAATVGSISNEVTTQMNFVSSMQTNLTNGVGALVDADMNQVSTRLQALQTQQQLGVQSLSIANQSSQMILKLFQ